MKNNTRGPLVVAIVLLLLPMLYLASYLLLVQPGGTLTWTTQVTHTNNIIQTGSKTHYLRGGRVSEVVFLPLEQIDRKVRPLAWDDSP
jgi:hypothetical protein